MYKLELDVTLEQLSAITRALEAIETPDNPIKVGDSVTITGANNPDHNGSFTVKGADDNNDYDKSKIPVSEGGTRVNGYTVSAQNLWPSAPGSSVPDAWEKEDLGPVNLDELAVHKDDASEQNDCDAKHDRYSAQMRHYGRIINQDYDANHDRHNAGSSVADFWKKEELGPVKLDELLEHKDDETGEIEPVEAYKKALETVSPPIKYSDGKGGASDQPTVRTIGDFMDALKNSNRPLDN